MKVWFLEVRIEDLQPYPLPPPLAKKSIRLHGQEFNLRVKFKGLQYFSSNKSFIFDNNRVKLFDKSIEIYSGHDFFGDSVWEARMKSVDYFRRFFNSLQDRLGSTLNKIRQVNAHYSECDNELATDCNNKKKYLVIHAEEDDKVWAKIDSSLNINELETLHPKTADKDMEKVVDFFNSIRQQPFTAYDFKNLFKVTESFITTQKEYVSAQKEYGENIKTHTSAIKEMRDAIKELRDEFKKKKS